MAEEEQEKQQPQQEQPAQEQQEEQITEPQSTAGGEQDEDNKQPASENNIVEGTFGEVTDTSRPNEEGDSQNERNLEMLYDIPVTVSVRLGETEMSIKELLQLKKKSVIELDKDSDEDVDLLINGIYVGKGDVVVVDDKFGLRITEITPQQERLEKI